MARLKQNPAAGSLESELAGLLTTRDNLQARQTALTTELEQAVARRRELLIQGSDAAAIAEAERACREVEGTAAGIADALAEVERRISGTEAKIEEARIAGEREAAAATLERDSKAIDAAAERVRQAVADLAKAHAALGGAISVTAAPHFSKYDFAGRRDGESPERVAAYLTGHMLSTALPDLAVSEAGRQEQFGWVDAKPIEATAGDAPAKALLTEPMRELAGQIRAGETSPDLPRFHRPEPNFEPQIEEVQIYAREPFQYVGATGSRQMVSSPVAHVPEMVAERAIEMGLASRAETLAWRKNWPGHHHGSASATTQRIGWDECVSIDFDLGAWRRAEAQRRREAWLAEQDRQAA
ncbi:hypothetical protein [Methylorubrum populi]|uniref:Uncharacterized protein n=1 Tax=Methylorubrum populi TaxID=223967 RepID=A0A833J0I5_9HYPH|nr:hypothetical protein [Methylorubrum populi]KAB7782290.1 hypothetical protein F8B43_5045 [Methylorubrum populi]